MSQAVALVDCNNFFVSCERVFRPDLNGQPVVVLSNNDGCVISRSNEAKALEIAMGVPLFQIKPILKRHSVHLFSANFTLYGDLSHRVMTTVAQFTPRREVYSIDEAFLDLSHIDNRNEYARHIRNTVLQWTKIPTSIGIAETKTLAKIAAQLAKKSPKAKGVLDLTQSKYQEMALARIPLRDVWGIGWRLSERLRKHGIKTALDLRNLDEKWALQYYSVILVQTILELRGVACNPIETVGSAKKNIMTSRSFGYLLTTLEEMSQAIAYYTARTAEKLRQEGLAARGLSIYIRTHRHRDDLPQYGKDMTITLPVPTQSSHELISYALQALHQIFKPGYQYYKAGVVALDLVPEDQIQQNLWDTCDRSKLNRLAQTLDQINARHGSGTLRYAIEGPQEKPWRVKREYLSPAYTSQWSDLPEIELNPSPASKVKKQAQYNQHHYHHRAPKAIVGV